MCLYTHTYVIFQWRIPNICIGSSTIDNKWNVFQSHSFHLHTLFPFDMFPSIFNHLHSIINHNKLLLFYLGFSHSSLFSAPWQISYGIQENYITQRKTQALNKHYSKYLLVFTVIKLRTDFICNLLWARIPKYSLIQKCALLLWFLLSLSFNHTFF